MHLNDTLKHFELPGTDGKIHSTQDFDTKKALVIIVTCNHCPYAQAYVNRIHQLHSKYAEEVGFIAINGNDADRYPMDAADQMVPMAAKLGLHPYYLHDEPQEVLSYLRAERTPEVFLFDGGRKCVYKGAIDDNWESADKAKRQYLQEAIEAVLNNQSITEAETPPVGCSIKWKPVGSA
jgi:thiol-disulfide isomerase/thioredoxin